MNQDVYEMYRMLTPENKRKVQRMVDELLVKQRIEEKSESAFTERKRMAG